VLPLKLPLTIQSIQFQSKAHCCSSDDDNDHPTLTVTFYDGGGGSFYELQPQSGLGIDPAEGVALAAMLKAICEHNDVVEEKVVARVTAPARGRASPTPTGSSSEDSGYTVIDSKWIESRKGLVGKLDSIHPLYWFRFNEQYLYIRQRQGCWFACVNYNAEVPVPTTEELLDLCFQNKLYIGDTFHDAEPKLDISDLITTDWLAKRKHASRNLERGEDSYYFGTNVGTLYVERMKYGTAEPRWLVTLDYDTGADTAVIETKTELFRLLRDRGLNPDKVFDGD
jgi:hypothetical protein